MQKAMNVQAFYALEFISERFDRLDKEEQIKVIIHELMHIPATFGGDSDIMTTFVTKILIRVTKLTK